MNNEEIEMDEEEAKMEKLELLYEGKAKKIYRTNKKEQFLVEYKDDATAFNGEKKVRLWVKEP